MKAGTKAGTAASAVRAAGRLGAIAALALLPGAVLVTPLHSAAAQQPAQGTGRVAGTVLNPTGVPVSSVQVSVVGTRLGAITDAKGKYTINGVPAGAVTVRTQRIGFQPRTQQVTVTADGVTTADFQLTPAATVLSEVRVQVGYTNEARRDVTGAVATVTGNEIQDQKVPTIEQAIRGRVPGVQVSATGEPGRAAQIVVRGQQTLGDPSPLYVVDGMYVGTVNPNINPDDIQTITVLKDASAAAQYGAQASKGVIVITTRHGSVGPNQFSLNTYYGFQQVPKRMDLAGTTEWQALWLQSYKNAGITDIPAGITTPTNISTNWQDQVFQSGAIQNYNLQAAGGTTTANYLISGSFLDQNGTIIATSFRRASLRANSQAKFGRVTVGENLAVSQNNTQGLNNPALGDVARMTPVTPVYDSTTPSGFGYGSAAVPTFGSNPVAERLARTAYYRSNEVLGSVFGDVALFGGLRYRLNAGLDYNDQFNRFFTSIDQIAFRAVNPYATLTQQRPQHTNTLVENLLNYDGDFGDGVHRITAAGGFTTQRVNDQFLAGYRQGFTDEQLQQLDAGLASGQTTNGNNNLSTLNSELVRVSYAFRDKYLVTGSARRDCSSRFSPDNKCGTFGAGSIGWVASEESFFQAIPVIGRASLFKLRASTGVLGDQNIGNYAYTPNVALNQNYFFNGAVTPGQTQIALVNNNLKWQSNRSSDIGLDLGVFNNTLTLTADYFSNKVSNLLVRTPLPLSLGSSTDPNLLPLANVGALNNAGFELGAAHHLTHGAFQFNTTFNVSTIKNRVTSLGNGGQSIPAGPGGVARTAVGDPIGSWYVRQTCGIFQSDAAAAAHKVQPDARAGDVCYVDRNGDGVINDDDRYVAGSGIPKVTGGLFFDGRYKNVDFGLNLTGKYGYKIFNAIRQQLERLDDLSGTLAGYSPWSPTNPSTTTPIALFNANGPAGVRSASNAYTLSDRWLDNGSFTRIQNVILGYTLPESVLQRLRLGATRRPRVYVNIQNLYTFTSYPNWSPDVLSYGDPLARGVDEGNTYPQPRTYTFGLDVRF